MAGRVPGYTDKHHTMNVAPLPTPAFPPGRSPDRLREDVSAGEAVAGGIGIWAIGSILALILVVWAVMDLIKKPYPMEKKLIWGVVILVIPFLGAILYFLLGRNKQTVI